MSGRRQQFRPPDFESKVEAINPVRKLFLTGFFYNKRIEEQGQKVLRQLNRNARLILPSLQPSTFYLNYHYQSKHFSTCSSFMRGVIRLTTIIKMMEIGRAIRLGSTTTHG